MLHNTLLKNMKINYILYSHIAAKTVRLSLKPDLQKLAKGRDLSSIQIYKFVNGSRGPAFQPLRVTPIEERKT